MATGDPLAIFNRFLAEYGAAMWTSEPMFGALGARTTWTPDPDDEFVQDAIAAGWVEMSGGGYAREAATLPSVTQDNAGDRALIDLANFNFGTITGTDAYDTFILYVEVTDDTDSYLVGAWDLGSLAANSTQVLVNLNAAGLFELVWAP